MDSENINVRRISITAFLAVALLISTCSLLVISQLEQQKNMLKASTTTFEMLTLLERASKQITLMLDQGNADTLPDRLLLKLRDDLISTTETITQRQNSLSNMLITPGNSLLVVPLQTLNYANTAKTLIEIDEIWSAFQARINKIAASNAVVLRARSQHRETVDALIAYNGPLFKKMSYLNQIVYQASLQQNQQLRMLYAMTLILILVGLWTIWFFTLRPLSRKLSASYREIISKNHDLDFQANHDAMTKLLNRAAFNRKSQQLDDDNTSLRHCCLVLIDLDEFKPINDTLGHHVGDAVLKKVANDMQTAAADNESAYRLGGDEFVLLLEAVETRDQVTARLDSLLQHIRQPMDFEGHTLHVSCSLGVAWGWRCGNTIKDFLTAADTALYKVKDNGRNHYRFYSDISKMHISELKNTDQELHYAVQRQEFLVYYQPIIDLKTGLISRLEALVRWQHPEHGLLLPDKWLKNAERLNLDTLITHQVIDTVAHDYASWKSSGFTVHPINVNITEKMLLSGEAFEKVTHILQQSENQQDQEKPWLGIEVTESIFLERAFDIMKAQLERIHASGISIALDDFGTGFASLSHLQKIPFDTLKIDKTFTAKILTDDGVKSIVESLINLSHGLNKLIVCEGVENENTKRSLIDMGCTYSQGFLHSRPLSFRDTSRLLAT